MRFIYIVSLFTLLLMTGCSKSFLDQKPYTALPVDDAIKTVEEMAAAMNGVYQSMQPSTVYGRHIPVFGDLMADNVYISNLNSGRYLVQSSYATTVSSSEPDEIWTGLYNIIKNANVVINADIPSSEESDQLRGEALTVRALAHFDLVQLFATPYSVNPNAEGIPIITSFDQNAKPSRDAVSAVYNQILTDLTDAFGLMTVTDNSSAYITKYVARALEAKVHLYMGNWEDAMDAAQDVVDNSGFTLVPAADFGAYWKNPAPGTSKVETMFELTLDASNHNGTTALAYMYDQDGYGDLLATDNLYNLYSATDVRRSLIIAGVRNSLPVWIVNKYQNGSNPDKDDIKMLRFAEVVLILAEAYYRMDDEDNARLYLNMVAETRDPSFAGYSSTGAALLEDIINERRKELAFEGGRLQDLLRLNRDIVRGPQYPAGAQLIPTTNGKRIQPIPQTERDANPNISQNDAYQ